MIQVGESGKILLVRGINVRTEQKLEKMRHDSGTIGIRTYRGTWQRKYSWRADARRCPVGAKER